MKQIIIDTNCLISFVTNRNPAQQEKVARLLSDAATLRQTILCHHHALSEFVYVLGSVYQLSDQIIHDMITALIAMPGVKLVTDVDMETVLNYWPNHISDYGDAVIVGQCKNHKGSAIATFDKKLKNAAAALGLPIHDF